MEIVDGGSPALRILAKWNRLTAEGHTIELPLTKKDWLERTDPEFAGVPEYIQELDQAGRLNFTGLSWKEFREQDSSRFLRSSMAANAVADNIGHRDRLKTVE